MALKQVYNSRSKKWVLYDDAKRSGIIKMQAEPFEGIEKNSEPEKEKTEETVIETVEMKTETAQDYKGVVEDEKENESKESDESPGGWFSVLGF